MPKPKLKRTLYIGLGGTGFKTLLHTKRAFIETYGEVPPMIKFLAFDSDQNQYKTYTLPSSRGEIKFDPNESSDIMVTNAVAKVKRARTELSWLPDSNIDAVGDLTNGCGMVRTNGRLAFAFNYQKSKTNIQNALNTICNLNQVHNDNYDLTGNDIDVILVFSIAGGTGSGNFIDMAYVVKDIMRQQALPETSKVIGYMVLPDVYEAQLVFNKTRLTPNGYGSLLDFDYLMHRDDMSATPVNYLTTKAQLEGKPFNAVFAIGNSNLNGDVVTESDHLSQMMSLAMVVSAGELSGGVNSIANNVEVDMRSRDFEVGGKNGILAALGMSEITFRATELSNLFSLKVAREIAAALINPGSNVDTAANTWIDEMEIRENNGKDQVIDFLLPKEPGVPMSTIYDKANPRADVEDYRGQKNVAVNPALLSNQVNALKNRINDAFDAKVRSLVNTYGPTYTKEFNKQVKGQIQACLGEMRDELAQLQQATARYDGAIKACIEEYKNACKKIIGKGKAVNEATDSLCQAVRTAVINDREQHRRQGAITFYTWLISKIDETDLTLDNIETNVKNACAIISATIANVTNNLNSPRGLFEVDLTGPYVNRVIVNPDDVDLNQFVSSLTDENKIFGFGSCTPEEVANKMLAYASTVHTNGTWQSMSVEDALKALSKNEVEDVIQKAIKLASPMCRTNYQGELEPQLSNYYFVGVQEQSSTCLNGALINFDNCIQGGEMHQTQFASIGSRDRIVIYHQLSVFPTFALSGSKSYALSHSEYMSRGMSFSCHIDEDIRVKMMRDGFTIFPKEQVDNSLELWVKGLIYGLIKRDEDGTFMYKDETNDDAFLDDYWTSLETTYRDEAFRNFKTISPRIEPQYEEVMSRKARAEGEAAIEALMADAKSNYMDKYSLNDISKSQLNTPPYKPVKDQLQKEMVFVRDHLTD